MESDVNNGLKIHIGTPACHYVEEKWQESF
jgi:hypothetical protein